MHIVQGWTHRLRAVGQKQAPLVSTLSRDICTLAWESGLPNNRLESRVMEKSKHLDLYGDFACICLWGPAQQREPTNSMSYELLYDYEVLSSA